MTRPEVAQALRAVLDLGTDRRAALSHADVATLESAIEILEQVAIVCDEHKSGACVGPVYARTCADCEHTITRCEVHGGRKSASRLMWLHRERQEHGRSA
jgi:hypothetical protein